MVPATGIPPFTLPFHFATWICLLAAQSYTYCPNAGLTPQLVHPVSWADRERLNFDTNGSIEGVLKGVGQVFLLEDSWSGVTYINNML